MTTLTEQEVPRCVTDAASRIAGTALGPFIMGQRNVDLDALEQRITAHVIREMNIFGLIVLKGMLTMPHIVVEIQEPKPKRRNPKATKSGASVSKRRAEATQKRKTAKNDR